MDLHTARELREQEEREWQEDLLRDPAGDFAVFVQLRRPSEVISRPPQSNEGPDVGGSPGDAAKTDSQDSEGQQTGQTTGRGGQ